MLVGFTKKPEILVKLGKPAFHHISLRVEQVGVLVHRPIMIPDKIVHLRSAFARKLAIKNENDFHLLCVFDEIFFRLERLELVHIDLGISGYFTFFFRCDLTDSRRVSF